MNYSVAAIEHLTQLIKGDKVAGQWLRDNNFPELILLRYAIDGNESALKELTSKKYIDLVAVAHAILGEIRASNWLMENKKYVWSAVVKITYKDKKAEAWLIKNTLKHYAELGNAIRKNEEDLEDQDIFGVFKQLAQFLKKLLIPRMIR